MNKQTSTAAGTPAPGVPASRRGKLAGSTPKRYSVYVQKHRSYAPTKNVGTDTVNLRYRNLSYIAADLPSKVPLRATRFDPGVLRIVEHSGSR